VVAEIAAADGVPEDLGAIVKQSVRAQCMPPPQRGLITLDGVAVGEDLGAVAVKDEEVRVAPVSESRLCVPPELLS
jgi:hypothetical protein